jgi:hypothetical protein
VVAAPVRYANVPNAVLRRLRGGPTYLNGSMPRDATVIRSITQLEASISDLNLTCGTVQQPWSYGSWPSWGLLYVKWMEPQLCWEVGVMMRRIASLEIQHVKPVVCYHLSRSAAWI